jgi:hypothetical protein
VSRGRRSTIAAALVLAAVAASAPSASAAGVPYCTFTGVDGSFTPPMRDILNSGFGGNGVYTLEGRATCTHVNTFTRTTTTTGATIRSTGDFLNEFCEGSAWVSHPVAWPGLDPTRPKGTTIDFDSPALTDITQMSYTVRFVRQRGVVRVDAVNGQPTRGGGLVSATPLAGNCVTTAVTNFELAGDLVTP